MDKEKQKRRYFKLATDSYRKSDEKLWVTAYACGKVVGNYDRGATMGLADDIGVSSDTIEDLAHAYWLYNELCELDHGKFRSFVRNARKAPYIYYSHFRALYDARSQYDLTNNQVLDLLMDIVQGEGTISSRGVDGHTRSRFGVNHGWEWYAQRTQKELGQTLQQPDLPNIPEEIGQVFLVKLSSGNNKFSVLVVANNHQRAENIAKKEVQQKGYLKIEIISSKPMGSVITDSKTILSTTYEWLGDKA